MPGTYTDPGRPRENALAWLAFAFAVGAVVTFTVALLAGCVSVPMPPAPGAPPFSSPTGGIIR